MAAKQPTVILEPSVISDETGLWLCIEVANRSKAPVTVVALPRYFTVELKDDRGQFVRGEETDSGVRFPSVDDYRTIPANGVEEMLRLPITSDTVGTQKFAELPRNNEVRVTYKADRIMPNLPSKSRRNFFEGPTPPKSTPIQLP